MPSTDNLNRDTAFPSHFAAVTAEISRAAQYPSGTYRIKDGQLIPVTPHGSVDRFMPTAREDAHA